MNIEEKLALILRNSKTLRNYKWALRMLKSTAGNKDSYDVFDALKAIEAQKKPSSKQTLYYMLKKIYRIANWKWDDTIISLPEESWDQRDTPVFSKEHVSLMIKNSHKLESIERLALVFSTVWGMRRVEITEALNNEDTISMNDPPTIYIRTAKKGIRRKFLIPDEVRWIIKEFKPYKVTEWTVSSMFHSICYKTVGEIKPRFGYHAIRRALIGLLLPPYTTLSESEVFRFLRWSEKMAGAKAILYRYAYTAREEEWFELDKKIYEQHPWLKDWEVMGC